MPPLRSFTNPYSGQYTLNIPTLRRAVHILNLQPNQTLGTEPDHLPNRNWDLEPHSHHLSTPYDPCHAHDPRMTTPHESPETSPHATNHTPLCYDTPSEQGHSTAPAHLQGSPEDLFPEESRPYLASQHLHPDPQPYLDLGKQEVYSMRRPAPNQAYRAMDILHHRFTKPHQLLTPVVPPRYPSSQNSSRLSTPTTSRSLPPHLKSESPPDISGFQTPSVYSMPQLLIDSALVCTVTEPDTMRVSVAHSDVSLVVCTRPDTMHDTAPTEDSYDAMVATKQATSRCDALSEEPFRTHDAKETTFSPPAGNQ